MSDRVLAEIRLELEAIRAHTITALGKLASLGAGFAPASDAARARGPGVQSVTERIQGALPYDLLPKFTVVDQGSGLVTIQAEWLGKEDWGRVDQKVKSMGGTWIKDGKNSRWEVTVHGSGA